MTNPSHTRRSKVEKQARRVVSSLRAYEKAARAYNRDCNMRCPILPGDIKNLRLMWKSHNAFEKTMSELHKLLDLSARMKNTKRVRVSTQKKAIL